MIKRVLFSVPVVVLLYVLTGCENSLLDRSLIFATHTTLGVELSLTPAEASGPVNIIIGYKRSEGVLNPVYDREYISTSGTDGNGVQDKYRKQAYSVVAKLAGEVKASAGSQAEGTMEVSQWFATGRAANIIARNDVIAAAVTGNTGIAQAIANIPPAHRLEGLNEDYALIVLGQIYNALVQLKKDDPKSGEHVEGLDRFASLAVPRPFTAYQWGVGADSGKVIEESKDYGAGFLNLIPFIANMKTSRDTLTEAIDKGSFNLQKGRSVQGQPEPTQVAIKKNDQEYKHLSKTLLSIREMFSAHMYSLVKDERVVGAVTYYIEVITGRKQGSTRE